MLAAFEISSWARFDLGVNHSHWWCWESQEAVELRVLHMISPWTLKWPMMPMGPGGVPVKWNQGNFSLQQRGGHHCPIFWLNFPSAIGIIKQRWEFGDCKQAKKKNVSKKAKRTDSQSQKEYLEAVEVGSGYAGEGGGVPFPEHSRDNWHICNVFKALPYSLPINLI